MLFSDDDQDVRQTTSFCFDCVLDDNIESYTDPVKAFCAFARSSA